VADEHEIARRAVERGWLSEEQLAAARAERRSQVADGLHISLRELLLDGGHLDTARWERLARGDDAERPSEAETRAERPSEAETRSDPDTPPPSAEEEEQGEVLGEYRIVGELGRGAMGVVYEAVQEGLGRRVALKVLPEASALQGTARARFLREAQATAALKHPGIVPIYAIGEARGVHFFAMELLAGASLKRVLEDGPLDPTRAARIAQEAAEALAYAHAQGVIHRDVKPDNIVLREDGRAVVTDFGLARRVSDGSLTREGVIVGTPLYMAPEQARGDGGPVDARADVYGLGVTLYELLAGSPPFESARDTGVLLQKIERDDPEPLGKRVPGLPTPLIAIVETALEKDPAQRYQGAAALAADLGRFLAGEPILARPPSRLRRTLRRLRRSSRPLLLAATLLACALTAGLVLRQLSRRWQADALVLESMSLAQAGQVGPARARLDAALALSPGLPEALFRRAVLDQREGVASDLVLAGFDAALARDPEHVDALLARAELYRELARDADALTDLEAARRAAKGADPRPALAGGLVLVDLGRSADGQAWLRDGVDLARRARTPRDALYARALTGLGALSLAAENPQAALADLEEAVQLSPSQVEPRLLLARALIDLDRAEIAVDAAAAALARDPESLEGRRLRAEARRQLGQTIQAAADLDAAAARPAGQWLRGLLRFEAIDSVPLGAFSGPPRRFDRNGSAEDLRFALASDRLTPRQRALALTVEGWLELGGSGRRSPAEKRWTAALEAAPDAAFPRLSRGLVRLRAGHLDEAEGDLKAALELPGGAYGARIGLSRLALKRGDAAAARAHLDRAIALDPERTTAYGDRFRIRLGARDAGARSDWKAGLTRNTTPDPRRLVVSLQSDPIALAEASGEAGFGEFAQVLQAPADRGQLERAEAWLERALLLDPWQLSASARRASVLYLRARFRAAFEAYGRAREVDPTLLEAELMRGVLERDLLEEGPEAAEETLRQALREAPPSPDLQGRLRYELAMALVRQGRERDALPLLAEARRFTPERYCVAAQEARILHALDLAGAKEAAARAARIFSGGKRDRIRGALYGFAGMRTRRNEAMTVAEHFLTRAIEADHRHAPAWRERARTRFEGNPELIPRGFVDAYVAAELDPTFTGRFFELEQRLERFKPLFSHVQDRIDEILAAAPDLPAAAFVRGYLAFHLGDPARAEEGFEEAYRLSSGQSYFALVYRGATRLKRGDLEAAAADLDAAEAIFPHGPVTSFWRSCLWATQGRDEEIFDLLDDQAKRGFRYPRQLRTAPELERLLDHPRMKPHLTQ
jgi:serine/threonine protein kinase/Tfp pilus assembly protein PilF